MNVFSSGQHSQMPLINDAYKVQETIFSGIGHPSNVKVVTYQTAKWKIVRR